MRDVAAWIITQIENQQNGVFNVASPDGWATMGSVLQACMNVIQSDAELKWVPEDFLIQNSVGEWIEMPLWLAESDPSVAGSVRLMSAVRWPPA